MDDSVDIIYDELRIAYHEIYNEKYTEGNIFNHKKFILDVNKVLELMFRTDEFEGYNA